MASKSFTIATSAWNKAVSGATNAAAGNAQVTLRWTTPTLNTTVPLEVDFSGSFSSPTGVAKAHCTVMISITNTTNNKTASCSWSKKNTTSPALFGGQPKTVNLQCNTNATNTFKVTVYQMWDNDQETLGSVLYYTYTDNTNLTVFAALPVTAPTAVSVSATTVTSYTTITASWSGAAGKTNNAISGYIVQRRIGSGGTWTNVSGKVTGSSTVVEGPTASGQTAYYRIAAVGALNTAYSTATAVCSYISTGLGAPGNFATSSSEIGKNETATFTWTAATKINISGTVSYQVQYSTNSGSSWANLGSSTTNLTQSIQITLNAGTNALYKVVATCGSYSASSNTAWMLTTTVNTCRKIASDCKFTSTSVAIGKAPMGANNQPLTLNYLDQQISTDQKLAGTAKTTAEVYFRKSPWGPAYSTRDTYPKWNQNTNGTLSNGYQAYNFGCAKGKVSNESSESYEWNCIYDVNAAKFGFIYYGYLTNTQIAFGTMNTVIKLQSGLTMVIKKIPIGSTAAQLSDVHTLNQNWFEDGSSFLSKPMVYTCVQDIFGPDNRDSNRIYDGAARVYDYSATKLIGLQMLNLADYPTVYSTVSGRGTAFSALLTVIAIGRK